jgi:hypothetical protein
MGSPMKTTQRESTNDALRHCQPHLERAGVRVLAAIVVEGTALCRLCFAGHPIIPSEAEMVMCSPEDDSIAIVERTR